MGKCHHVRWMIKRDMPRVLEIENQIFEYAWTEEDFIRCLRQRNAIGMVVESDDGEIIGFMVYEMHKNRLGITNFAVAEGHRRQGVAKAMVAKLTGKLSFDRRDRVMLEIRETNLDAQLAFKAMGFQAVSILRDFYEDTIEDAYLMCYRYIPTTEERIRAGERARLVTG